MHEDTRVSTLHEREESRLVEGKAMASESQQLIDHMQVKDNKKEVGETDAQNTTLGDTETTQASGAHESESQKSDSWNDE